MGYTQEKGQFAEELACRFLQRHGLNLMARNYYCRFGEIDLIMQQDGTIVFVEVRYRKSNNLVDGASSVDTRKQKKLYRSAEYYLQKSGIHHSVPARFDVVAITQSANADPEIDWIQNAIEG